MSKKTRDEYIDIDATEEPEEEEKDNIKYQITYYPSDLTLKGYLDKWNDKQLIIPEFQRQYVWDQIRASKLIESFLLGLPVPGVFLYKERKTNNLLVIDGQQRIMTAIRFFTNKFDEKIFRLKNVNSKWNEKTYDDLSKSEKYALSDSILRATIVQQVDPNDDSSIYHIFERLNTGGMNLTPMEIRKCVYYSAFFKLLEELNKNGIWRSIIGNKILDKRLRDVEFILRFLAMRDGWENYEKPMKSFLNYYMAKHKSGQADDTIDETRKVFLNTCQYIIDKLGEKPFHLRGKLNLAVMDSVMTMMSIAAEKQIRNTRRAFTRLLKDKKYYEDVTINTSDNVAVGRRFKKAIQYHLAKT